MEKKKEVFDYEALKKKTLEQLLLLENGTPAKAFLTNRRMPNGCVK